MNDKAISFWSFIQQTNIEIPIIQRDYAQGRADKKTLRKRFLVSLKQALDSTKRLTLDFVYGSIESGTLRPLDGQQRLTTLWLLHWYIALRAGKLESASLVLRKFSYETRISSREFCRNLCEASYFTDFCKEQTSIKDYIQNRTWFYASWQQDPTIKAMLTTLAGTDGSEDGIEPLYADEDYIRLWMSLTGDACPIVFYHQPLKDFGLTDDLYIKMNARGKQLTAFENFKADLIGYIQERQWTDLLDPMRGFPIKLDTDWMEIFWHHHSPKFFLVDEIFFAFINRFFWNELFIARDADGRYLLNVNDGNESKNASYGLLNSDPYASYEGLELYRYDHNEIPHELFERLQTVLDRLAAYKDDIPCAPWVKDFHFLPVYVAEDKDNSENVEVSKINQLERIAFFAVCKYLLEGDVEPTSFERWMRVVWNLISGEDEDGRLQIRSVQAVRTAIQYLGILDSHDVYASLCHSPLSKDIEKKETALGLRWDEEIAKARQISEGGSDWEKKIIEAEHYAFFKGAIRFLYLNGKGEIDWSLFDRKWATVKKYFLPQSQNPSTQSGYQNATLLKILISRFSEEQFYKVLWWSHRTFNNKPQTWLYYLLNNNIMAPVHALLMGETDVKSLMPTDDVTSTTASSTISAATILYLLTNTGLLDYVVDNLQESWIRFYHEHIAIYPSSTGIFLNAGFRDHFLRDTPRIDVPRNVLIPGSALLFGSDINFSYADKHFRWYRTDYVYLMADANPNEYMERDATKVVEEERYYCFKAVPGMDILSELGSLVDEEKSGKAGMCLPLQPAYRTGGMCFAD